MVPYGILTAAAFFQHHPCGACGFTAFLYLTWTCAFIDRSMRGVERVIGSDRKITTENNIGILQG